MLPRPSTCRHLRQHLRSAGKRQAGASLQHSVGRSSSGVVSWHKKFSLLNIILVDPTPTRSTPDSLIPGCCLRSPSTRNRVWASFPLPATHALLTKTKSLSSLRPASCPSQHQYLPCSRSKEQSQEFTMGRWGYRKFLSFSRRFAATLTILIGVFEGDNDIDVACAIKCPYGTS